MHHTSRALWIVPAARALQERSRPSLPPALELHGHTAPGLIQSGLILLTIAILAVGLVVGACDHLVDMVLALIVH